MVTQNELICESGFNGPDPSFREGESTGKIELVCLPSPNIVDKDGPDYRCGKISDTCLYKSVLSDDVGDSENGENSKVYEFEMPCKCGLTPTGDAFCPRIFTEDYTRLYSEALQKLSGACHTLLRDDPYECLMLNVPADDDDDDQSSDFANLLNNFVIGKYSRDHNNEI